jgi:hypothetical protein
MAVAAIKPMMKSGTYPRSGYQSPLLFEQIFAKVI